MAPSQENLARVMPDVAASARPAAAGTLEWVGMGEIDAPVRVADGHGEVQRCAAKVEAFVDLRDPDARGIHMSRLYLLLDQAFAAEPLSPCSLRRLLRAFLESHAGLSERARVRIRFDLLLRRPALVSANSGWKAYPVEVLASLEHGQFALEVALELAYSSTCPCSAALARQLIQEQFARDFPEGAAIERERVLAWLGSEQGIVATPHSQRSRAEVRVRLAPTFEDFPIAALVDRVEAALATPVQTVVKREDEQAFALLNGQNLMFCEDAARRMQAVLDADERVADFWIRASHFESLHPHDAVAVATKGLAGGFGA
jgi:GTP cyclohydrolase I